MSRREIVVLVGRAVAVLLAFPALISLALLVPSLATQAYVRTTLSGALTPAARANLVLLGVPLLNAALHIVSAVFFWFCGPTAERMLAPVSEES